MKRSEVIKLISGLYDLEMGQYPKHNPPEFFAENLLCHLEELGMSPPKYNDNKPIYRNDDGMIFKESLGTIRRDWEPEGD